VSDDRSLLRLLAFAAVWIASLANSPMAAPVRPETTVASLNLFQRIARADLVVKVRIRNGGVRYAIVDVQESLKGSAPAPSLRIAFRDYNFFRPPGTDPIIFPDGEEDILLLVPYTEVKRTDKTRDLYELYGGPSGRYALPAEGSAIFAEAVRRLIPIASLDPTAQVDALWSCLETDNPYLLEAALDEIDRLRAVSPKLFVRLVGILNARSASIRILSLRLIGRVFAVSPAQESDDLAAEQSRDALNAVLERARGDGDESVRQAAVEAIVAWPRRPEVRGDLESIARLDPAQAVRYVAQRALLMSR
jgi:hypothetical protein